MRRRRGGAGTQSDELRPPIPSPSNRRSEVERESSPRVAYRGNGELPWPVVRERHVYYCEVCEHEADATYSDKYGVPGWLVGSTHVDRCPKGKECLGFTAAWLSEQLEYRIAPAELKQDPRPFLAQLDGEGHASTTPPQQEEPRDDEEWLECVRELRGFRRGGPARSYLRNRGIEPTRHDLGFTIRRGYDAFVARCYCGGEIVTEAFRSLDPRGRKNDVLSGCPVGWVGTPLPPDEVVLLVAGFLDAFSARQRGLPAISAIGDKLPDPLTHDLAGKIVAVAYDVGEEESAEQTTTKLRAAGNEAFVVHLEKLGLPHKGDLADYFAAGGSVRKLRTLVGAARRRS